MVRLNFDYAATTPVDPEVLEEMLPYFSKKFGNTTSFHTFGREAKQDLDKAKLKIARFLNCELDELIFTASATESNNMALKGLFWAYPEKKEVIISTIEHPSIEKPCQWLKKQGVKIIKIKVDKYGFLNLEELKEKINSKTLLVSVIHGQNEIGTIQDLKAIGEICQKNNAFFHTDASQSFGKEEIDLKTMHIDLLTVSSHKMYGPKGAALLYKKRKIKIEPLLHGGGQENNLRSSTVNIPAIVGFAKAIELCYQYKIKENLRLIKLRDKIVKKIKVNIDDAILNGHPSKRLSNNIHFSFLYVEGESLLMDLSLKGIAVSTGSACSSSKLQASPILLALGLEQHKTHGSIRISLGRWTTKEDVDILIKELINSVKKYRKISPLKN